MQSSVINRIIVCLIPAVLGLAAIPLFWSGRVVVNFGILTTEWYKAWWSLCQLLIGFVLVNILLDVYKQTAGRNAAAAVRGQLGLSAGNVRDTLRKLLQYMDGDATQEINDHVRVQYATLLLRFDATVRQLSAVPFLPGESAALVSTYQNTVAGTLLYVVTAITTGKPHFNTRDKELRAAVVETELGVRLFDIS